MKNFNHLKSGKRTIKIESKGLDNLAKTLSTDFNEVCEKLLSSKGKIITLGIGKSGHIAKKNICNLIEHWLALKFYKCS